jgi:hypothetical protein
VIRMKTSLDRVVALKILEKALEISRPGSMLEAAELALAARVDVGDVERLLDEVVLRFGSSGRVALGLAAVEYGADPQRIARYLTWREMEEFTADAAKAAGLGSVKNLHLKVNGRRFQIDLIAYTSTHCIIFDCKRWGKRLAGKTLEQVVGRARNRTLHMTEWLSEKAPGTHTVFFTTVVLTVYEPAARQLNNVFIVPVKAMPELLRNHVNLLSNITTHKKLSETWYEIFG